MAYVEHWIFDPNYDNDNSLTPKSRKQSIIPCQDANFIIHILLAIYAQNVSYGSHQRTNYHTRKKH
jgi:hypothetical protein